MSERTGIEWTDATWNPVTGCTRVSEGCRNCYMARVLPRQRLDPWKVTLHPGRLDQPLRWQKPRRVFVNSLSDLFHEDVPDSFIDQVFAVMGLCQGDWGYFQFGRDYMAEGDRCKGRQTFQILTKRPDRMLRYVTAPTRHSDVIEQAQSIIVMDDYDWSWAWPLPNVWLGVSVEDQATAIERITLLLQTPAAVRFLSVEPLLGPINLSRWLPIAARGDGWERVKVEAAYGESRRPAIDWVIVGGESGPGARPMHPDWVRAIRDQCVAAGVPFFFKQWGEWCPPDHIASYNGREDQEMFRCDDGTTLFRVGKKYAGRLLDGRTWEEIPGVRP